MTTLNEATSAPDTIAKPLVARREWLFAALGLALLVAATVAGVLYLVRSAQSPVDEPEAAVPADLTATPEDMEAQGEAAITVLAPDDARAKNAAVPITVSRPDPAKAFRFAGSSTDRSRALECLAAAVLYEAGDDTTGQAAVAQVVLNRVRHPAFPGTVCGVVYQGSERRTGCQFTFTCDGSLARRMSTAAWGRARNVARRAIEGFVDPSVGLATHYHTDWVYPYWSPSLNKLAKVGTHIFFGWPGGAGRQAAFSRVYRGNESLPSRGTAMSEAGDLEESGAFAVADPDAPKILGLPQPKAELPDSMGTVPLYGTSLRLVGADERSFGLLAPSGVSAAKLVNAALALCDKPGPCRVNAWGNEDDVPGAFPIPSGAGRTMVFEYVRSGNAGGAPRFDCERYPNKDPQRCLSPRLDPGEILSGARFKQ